MTKTNGVSTVVPGAGTTYTIVVSNAGPSDVSGASVVDTFPAVLSGVTYTAVGSGGASGFTASGSGNINDAAVNLPVGSSVTYTAVANLSSAATGTMANTAAVTAPATTTDPDTGNNSATDTDTLTPRADLWVTKTDGVSTAVPGAGTTYTIMVSNAGPSDVSGASVADTFPAVLSGVTYTAAGSGGASGFTASGSGNINDAVVNLPVGSSVTYTAVANLSSAATGTLANTATISAPGGTTDPNPANNSATDTDTLTPQADLRVTKTAPAMVDIGAIFHYTVTITNLGPSDAQNVALTDNLPLGTTFDAQSWISGPAFTLSNTGNSLDDTISSLASGASSVIDIAVRVDEDALGRLDLEQHSQCFERYDRSRQWQQRLHRRLHSGQRRRPVAD